MVRTLMGWPACEPMFTSNWLNSEGVRPPNERSLASAHRRFLSV